MTVEEMLAERPNTAETLDMDELQEFLRVLDPRIYARRMPPINTYLDDEPAHIRCACTACGQTFASYHKRIRDITRCPECGIPVTPKQWRDGYKHINSFFFTHLIRGRGRAVWVRSYKVEQMLDEDGLTIETTPFSIYYFDDGVAEKFAWNPYSAEWTRVKSQNFSGDIWYKGRMNSCAYHSFIGYVDPAVIDGSCLAYSQLTQAIDNHLPMIPYICMYIKYPAIEYLWKAGCERLIIDYLCHRDKYFRKAVNLRAKNFKGLFYGADKAEMRVIPKLSANQIIWFHKLYQAGVIRANQAGVDWACARMNFYREAGTAEAETTLYRYIKRQAQRAGLSTHSCLGDYTDYLHQLDEIGGGERYPHDLQEAHERLSARLRKMKDTRLQGMFRARRRLWGWASWRYQGMFIRPIDSLEEITAEGERQNNCVASYAKRHAIGQTVIFVLRKKGTPKTNWHTVELDPKTLSVRQCRGYRNADAAPEAEVFIADWTKHLQNKEKGR